MNIIKITNKNMKSVDLLRTTKSIEKNRKNYNFA